MARTYEMKTYSSKTLAQTKCDLCGKSVAGGYNGSWNDGVSGYRTLETHLEMRDGNTWPADGFMGERIVVDICPDCFRGKLIPWLESMGVAPHKVDCLYGGED